MNMPKDKSIDNAVVSATQEAIPDINVLAAELANLLKRNIEAYVSPDHPKVKQALINQIAVIKYSESHAVISVQAIKPSIFADLGLYGSVDLAIIYNKPVKIKPDAIYYNNAKGIFTSRRPLRIGQIPGFSHGGGHYLEKTVREFNSRYSFCKVTLSD